MCKSDVDDLLAMLRPLLRQTLCGGSSASAEDKSKKLTEEPCNA